jgi:hypothetical protein
MPSEIDDYDDNSSTYNSEYYYKLFKSLSFQKTKRGCNRKCACRLWINCPYYNSTLKMNKKEKLKREKEIEEWYSCSFRVHIEAIGDISNG